MAHNDAVVSELLLLQESPPKASMRYRRESKTAR
jgi:hypothetical protein